MIQTDVQKETDEAGEWHREFWRFSQDWKQNRSRPHPRGYPGERVRTVKRYFADFSLTSLFLLLYPNLYRKWNMWISTGWMWSYSRRRGARLSWCIKGNLRFLLWWTYPRYSCQRKTKNLDYEDVEMEQRGRHETYAGSEGLTAQLGPNRIKIRE